MRTFLAASCVVSLSFASSGCVHQRSETTGTDPAPEQPALPLDPPGDAVVGAPAWVLGPLSGLAKSVCPEGPFERPLEGERQAEEIPGTTPQDLDPGDAAFHLFEGPVWWGGALYFSDFRAEPGFPSRILTYSPGLQLRLAVGDAGTNGLALTADGENLLGASHKAKGVVRFAPGLDSVQSLVSVFEGRPFNSPNDLVSRSDGQLYFTDPDFQAGDQKTQPSTNVYWAKPDGEVIVVDATIKNPNGIALSPDEKFLFVAGNLDAGFVKRYPLAADGSVGEGSVIIRGLEVPDGLTVDCAGHLYVTEHVARRIRVVTGEGVELGRVVGFSKNVTNAAFGGPERKTLYITLTAGLAALELPVAGLPY